MKLTTLILFVIVSIAYTLPQEKVKWVYDETNFLTVQDSLSIDSALSELNKGTIRLGVYIDDCIPAIFNGSMMKAARKIGYEIGWGVKEGEIGAIIYIVPSEKELYFAFDDGLPYTNEQARTIYQSMIPHFKNEKYKDGILAGINKLKEIIREE